MEGAGHIIASACWCQTDRGPQRSRGVGETDIRQHLLLDKCPWLLPASLSTWELTVETKWPVWFQLFIFPIWRQPHGKERGANRTSGVLSDLWTWPLSWLMLSPNARVLRLLEMETHGHRIVSFLRDSSVWRPGSLCQTDPCMLSGPEGARRDQYTGAFLGLGR